MEHSGAQRDAADRPGHRLLRGPPVEAELSGFLDEGSDAHVDAGLGCCPGEHPHQAVLAERLQPAFPASTDQED
ncbi:hypothetical protein AB0J35_51385 [Nonomuraea angiospora]|uniref:hypothetical protein n=1 Tax=Nonomuraea angiospora TaxID=46172 RepID=UPI0034191C45